MCSLIEILTIAAIISGPILAVQVQKRIEKFREERDRKLNIFKTLMATRGQRLLFEHVRALNMIDIEFSEKKIIETWKNYLNCLNKKINNENNIEIQNWIEERDNLFLNLLKEMANLLNYHFDDDHIKKGFYIPNAHGWEEEYQRFIKDSIKKVFSEEKSIPIKITEFPIPIANSK
jgi:hypothetical protein